MKKKKKKMTWIIMWFNWSVVIINIILQFLDIYIYIYIYDITNLLKKKIQ